MTHASDSNLSKVGPASDGPPVTALVNTVRGLTGGRRGGVPLRPGRQYSLPGAARPVTPLNFGTVSGERTRDRPYGEKRKDRRGENQAFTVGDPAHASTVRHPAKFTEHRKVKFTVIS